METRRASGLETVRGEAAVGGVRSSDARESAMRRRMRERRHWKELRKDFVLEMQMLSKLRLFVI